MEIARHSATTTQYLQFLLNDSEVYLHVCGPM